jgi:hypothetical protein
MAPNHTPVAALAPQPPAHSRSGPVSAQVAPTGSGPVATAVAPAGSATGSNANLTAKL